MTANTIQQHLNTKSKTTYSSVAINQLPQHQALQASLHQSSNSQTKTSYPKAQIPHPKPQTAHPQFKTLKMH
ncbi:unnamed protein product [Nezara viridula]|uniref:Uncharacterized protein n=1 Tax=Nezara viridula TaxID=85310 RepID=A0A9P0H4G0_NEZVI|nr:unnamed protein product [Nezara viridula]